MSKTFELSKELYKFTQKHYSLIYTLPSESFWRWCQCIKSPSLLLQVPEASSEEKLRSGVWKITLKIWKGAHGDRSSPGQNDSLLRPFGSQISTWNINNFVSAIKLAHERKNDTIPGLTIPPYYFQRWS